MPKSIPIAIACGDLHLTLLRPACRADKDWMRVQTNYLHQLWDAAIENSRTEDESLPILCAGDIFDRWNPSPELIYFALENLPDKMICVPGQHDLPNHRIDGMSKSGYGVLVEAEKITNAVIEKPADDTLLWGFEWGKEITPCKKESGANLDIALIHKYIWTAEHKYPDAPQEAHVSGLKKQLQGYDIAITGDNHKHFVAKAGDCTVFNCGGFIRRKSDEINYKPCIGIIYSDGSVKEHFLDTTGDKFQDELKEREEVPINMKEFIEQLESLGEHGLNFREAVEKHLANSDIAEGTKKIIMKAME